jgi:hypothetical protein
MSSWKGLALIGATISFAAATELLLPLYNEPGTGGSAWAPVRTALAAHPKVSAMVIINVNNGPGSPFGTSQGADWIKAGKALGGLPNVSLLGYVPVNLTRRALKDAEQDVATWASWVSRQGIPIDGIFVDEAPATVNASAVAYMKSLTAYIRKNAGLDIVVYNAGFPATVNALDKYFDLDPDYIVGLETCFAKTSNGKDLCTPAGSYTVYDVNGYGATIKDTLVQWVGTKHFDSTAVLVHGFHGTNGLYQANNATLSKELQAVVQKGIGAVVFTTNHWLTPAEGPADIGTVVSFLDAANHS